MIGCVGDTLQLSECRYGSLEAGLRDRQPKASQIAPSPVNQRRFGAVSLSRIPILSLVLLLAGCSARTPPEPILLAHLAPRSGPDKDIGKQTEQAILLAVEEARASGEQIVGRDVAVLHPDTRGDLQVLQAEAIRVVTVNKVVGLLGGSDAAQAERLIRVAQQYSVPLVTPSGYPVPGASSFAFSVGIAPSEQGTILARFVAKELKAARVAVLTDNRRPDSAALAEGFGKELRKLHISPVDEKAYQKEEEFIEAARQVVGGEPRAVLVCGAAGDFSKLRAALHKSGLAATVPVLFGGDECAPAALLAGRDNGNGVYRATAFVAEDEQPRVKEFVKTYADRFGKAPDVNAALAYDGFRVLFEALHRAQTCAGPKVREELTRIENFESLTGPLSLASDHSARRTGFIVRLDNGRVKIAKRYEPEVK